MLLENQQASSVMTNGAPKATGFMRRAIRSGAVAATAAVACVGLAGTANAATLTPGDFNPSYEGVATMGDCRIELGPVVDTTAYPNYRKIGGVRINCSSVHSYISATVEEQYLYGNRWVQYGPTNSGVRTYQSGSGNSILRTPAFCVGTRGLTWTTVSRVQIDSTVRAWSSPAKVDPAGC